MSLPPQEIDSLLLLIIDINGNTHKGTIKYDDWERIIVNPDLSGVNEDSVNNLVNFISPVDTFEPFRGGNVILDFKRNTLINLNAPSIETMSLSKLLMFMEIEATPFDLPEDTFDLTETITPVQNKDEILLDCFNLFKNLYTKKCLGDVSYFKNFEELKVLKINYNNPFKKIVLGLNKLIEKAPNAMINVKLRFKIHYYSLESKEPVEALDKFVNYIEENNINISSEEENIWNMEKENLKKIYANFK